MMLTALYNWCVTDERTGERRLTACMLTRVDAERASLDAPGVKPFEPTAPA